MFKRLSHSVMRKKKKENLWVFFSFFFALINGRLKCLVGSLCVVNIHPAGTGSTTATTTTTTTPFPRPALINDLDPQMADTLWLRYVFVFRLQILNLINVRIIAILSQFDLNKPSISHIIDHIQLMEEAFSSIPRIIRVYYRPIQRNLIAQYHEVHGTGSRGIGLYRHLGGARTR